ncbi:MAG TPA: nucleotide exchange factor GrpE [bacterium]|nr:nucleotide exchange factor GrpE [bacterium]
MMTEYAHGRPDVDGTPGPAEASGRSEKQTGETENPPGAAEESSARAGAVRPTDEADDLDALSADELREKLREARAESQRYWQQFLHSAADLENYKRLAVRERQDAIERTRRQVLGLALGVLDNLDRALASATRQDGGTKALVEGLRMAQRQMLDQLAVVGVRPIDALGKPFDPRLHEAVATVPPQGPQQAAGTIVGEVLRGYRLDDDVLRPAKVMVVSEREGNGRAER